MEDFLALTYHDPENRFGDDLKEHLEAFNLPGLEAVLIHGSKATVEKNSSGWRALASLGGRKGFAVSSTGRLENHGLKHRGIFDDFEPALGIWADKIGSRRLVYFDGDKLLMALDLWPNEVENFWENSRLKLRQDGIGTVQLERSVRAMATYPEEQKWTEVLVNQVFLKYLGAEAKDCTSGIFALSPEMVRGWAEHRHGFYGVSVSNTMYAPTVRATQLGLKVVGEPGEWLGSFETNYVQTQSEKRPKSAPEAITWLSTKGKTKGNWGERLQLADEWLGMVVGKYMEDVVKWRKMKDEVQELRRMLYDASKAGDRSREEVMKGLRTGGWIERLELDQFPFLETEKRGKSPETI